MKAAVYVRVSTEEQVDGYSLDAQVRAAKTYCEREGWDATFFEEAGASGTSTDKRPVFLDMIARCKAHQFDVILVHKLDRFARNREDAVVFKGLLKRAGIRVVSITEQFDDGPVGHMVEGIMECVAEWYSANLSVEVRKGQGERALAGKHHGKIPIGYCRTDDGLAAIDEQAGPVIREVFDLYMTGAYTLRDIRMLILDKLGRSVTLMGVMRILRNPFYFGRLNHRAEVLPGIQEPLITEETYLAVQNMIQTRGYSGGKPAADRCYELSGILLCDCGQRMYGQTINSKSGKPYFRYYHNDANYRNPDRVKHRGYLLDALKAEGLVNELLSRPIPKDWQDRVTDKFQKQTPLPASDHSAEKLERAKELYIAGDITKDEYQTLKASMNVSAPPAETKIDLLALRAIVQLPAEAWELARPEERCARNKLLLKSIHMNKTGIVEYELTDLAKVLFGE